MTAATATGQKNSLTLRRGADDVECPHCKTGDPYWVSTRRKYKCRVCYRQFSLLSGTMFMYTKLADDKIASIVWASCNSRASVNRIASDIDVQYRTAQILVQKVMAVMGKTEDKSDKSVETSDDDLFPEDECKRRFDEVLGRMLGKEPTFSLETGQPFNGPQLSVSELKRRGYRK